MPLRSEKCGGNRTVGIFGEQKKKRNADKLNKDRIGTAVPAERNDVVRYKKGRTKIRCPQPPARKLKIYKKKLKKGALTDTLIFRIKKATRPHNLYICKTSPLRYTFGGSNPRPTD